MLDYTHVILVISDRSVFIKHNTILPACDALYPYKISHITTIIIISSIIVIIIIITTTISQIFASTTTR